MSKETPILVVDDEDNDVYLLQRAARMASIKHPMQIVRNGEMAIAYLKGEDGFSNRTTYPLPELILLDLKMPRKSGFDVLTWLRTHPTFRRIVVIVMTSSREPQDIRKAYDLGANSYLVKPARFEDLVEALKVIESYWLSLNQSAEIHPADESRISVMDWNSKSIEDDDRAKTQHPDC